MSPFSAPVLVGAAIVSSPALWSAFVDGTTSLQSAFTRYLICAGLCWLGFAFFAMLVGPTPPSRPEDPNGATSHDADRVG